VDLVFNSLIFPVFLLLVLLTAYGLRTHPDGRKWFLILASYGFYGAWNPPFVLLLAFSTLLDWNVAKWMPGAGPRRKQLLLGMSLTGNLGLLGTFKYGDFLLHIFNQFLGVLGLHFHSASLGIILPVGISFYTFQTLSYAIDVYRGDMKPWPRFTDFALFVSFFPQLVAGPIVRASVFLPQCAEPRTATRDEFAWGVVLLVTGLFQKMFLADAILAPVADAAFTKELVSVGGAWIGVLAFSGQIFCDFAGYSTCAIGVAMMLGFALPDNFRYPYAACGFSDFWRRWHISLSTWLRDYLYIPLGGNRGSRLRTKFNLGVTMLLGGLWHGAAWHFVAWGGLHGLLLVAERRAKEVAWIARLGERRVAVIGGSVLTFVAICFTWVLFRARGLPEAVAYSLAMVGRSSGGFAPPPADTILVLAVSASLLAWHWWMRENSWEGRWRQFPSWLRAAALTLMLFSIFIWSANDRAFIYFKF
jgi:D-alanyl-lipoteichoic acid acyltransferase DltB (MBOAT superfamily)